MCMRVCMRASMRASVYAYAFEYRFVWVRMCHIYVCLQSEIVDTLYLYMCHTRDDNNVCYNPNLCDVPSLSNRRLPAVTFAIIFRLYHQCFHYCSLLIHNILKC